MQLFREGGNGCIDAEHEAPSAEIAGLLFMSTVIAERINFAKFVVGTPSV